MGTLRRPNNVFTSVAQPSGAELDVCPTREPSPRWEPPGRRSLEPRHYDLRGVRVPGVVRHVIDGRVGHEILHGVAARCGRVIEGLVEELVRALHGGQEVQAERGSSRCVAIDDVPYKVGVPGLPLEIGERLTLGRGVLDGLDDEHVEVVAAGDLFLDAEDGGLELLYQHILFGALPLHEVQNMLPRVGVWPCNDP